MRIDPKTAQPLIHIAVRGAVDPGRQLQPLENSSWPNTLTKKLAAPPSAKRMWHATVINYTCRCLNARCDRRFTIIAQTRSANTNLLTPGYDRNAFCYWITWHGAPAGEDDRALSPEPTPTPIWYSPWLTRRTCRTCTQNIYSPSWTTRSPYPPCMLQLPMRAQDATKSSWRQGPENDDDENSQRFSHREAHVSDNARPHAQKEET